MPRTSATALTLLTPIELTELLERNKLRQADAAWMVGRSERIVRGWGLGEYPVPQCCATILIAYDRKLLTAKKLVEIIGRPPPE